MSDFREDMKYKALDKIAKKYGILRLRVGDQQNRQYMETDSSLIMRIYIIAMRIGYKMQTKTKFWEIGSDRKQIDYAIQMPCTYWRNK
jgi:hypothetical protein